MPILGEELIMRFVRHYIHLVGGIQLDCSIVTEPAVSLAEGLLQHWGDIIGETPLIIMGDCNDIPLYGASKGSTLMLAVSQEVATEMIVMIINFIWLQNQIKGLLEKGVSEGDVILAIGEMFVHEMTHVRQIHEGRMDVSESPVVTWEGETWSAERIAQVGHFYLPWEQEAMAAGIAYEVSQGFFENMEHGWSVMHQVARAAGIIQ